MGNPAEETTITRTLDSKGKGRLLSSLPRSNFWHGVSGCFFWFLIAMVLQLWAYCWP